GASSTIWKPWSGRPGSAEGIFFEARLYAAKHFTPRRDHYGRQRAVGRPPRAPPRRRPPRGRRRRPPGGGSGPRPGRRRAHVVRLLRRQLETPPTEVAALMRLFARHLRTETARLVANGVRLEVVGRRDRLPAPLVAAIQAAELATAGGTALRFRLAVDYSARAAIPAGQLLPDV